MRGRRTTVAVVLAAAVVAGCGSDVQDDGPTPQDDGTDAPVGAGGDGEGDPDDDGGDGVAEAPAADGEPGPETLDDTVTIVDAVLTRRDGTRGVFDVTIQIRNDGDTSRLVVLPVSAPRFETVDGETRMTWYRTAVDGSDAATGEVTYDLSVPFVEAVAIAAGETWEPTDLTLQDPGGDLGAVTLLCLEVMPIPIAGTPGEVEPTGERGPVGSGWEDGEPVRLACGPVRVEAGS